MGRIGPPRSEPLCALRRATGARAAPIARAPAIALTAPFSGRYGPFAQIPSEEDVTRPGSRPDPGKEPDPAFQGFSHENKGLDAGITPRNGPVTFLSFKINGITDITP